MYSGMRNLHNTIIKQFNLNKIDRYLSDKGRVHVDKTCCTLNKPVDSLSTFYLELIALGGNLVKYC